MLIKCPECGKDVSDKSQYCVHCGYPIINDCSENNCKINNLSYDLSQELEMIINNVGDAHVIRSLRQKCGLSLNDAKRLYDIMNESKEIPDSFYCTDKTPVFSNTLRCPTCSSKSVEKISIPERVGSVAMLGVFSKRINKSFKCRNCGYTW